MRSAFLSIIVLTSTVVHAEDDWVYIVENNNSNVYVNIDSIESNLNSYYVESWQKYVSKKDSSYVLSKDRYYCKSKKIQFLEAHQYNNDGGYVEGDRQSTSTISAIPDSVGAELLNRVCTLGAYMELLKVHYGLNSNRISNEAQYDKIMNVFGSYAISALENYLDSFEGLD